MSKFMKLLPKISLWVLFAASLVITVLFFVGGSNTIDIAGTEWDEPVFTNLLLNWTYVLCALVVLITLAVSVMQFIKTFIANPKKGIVSSLVILLIVAIFAISWALGSAETINIIGYEGTDNTGFWAKYSDMCLYVAYTLGAGTLLALFGSMIYSKLK